MHLARGFTLHFTGNQGCVAASKTVARLQHVGTWTSGALAPAVDCSAGLPAQSIPTLRPTSRPGNGAWTSPRAVVASHRLGGQASNGLPIGLTFAAGVSRVRKRPTVDSSRRRFAVRLDSSVRQHGVSTLRTGPVPSEQDGGRLVAHLERKTPWDS